MRHVDGDGNEIVKGDTVGFLSDVEQVGMVVALLPHGKVELFNKDGFSGSYLLYAKKNIIETERCWLV